LVIFILLLGCFFSLLLFAADPILSPSDTDLHPKGSEPVARYKKYSLTASYLQPFKLYQHNFSVDSLLYYQKSENVLFSPQRISLGGISSVRGFKDQSLAGDSAGYWRNQLRWTKSIHTSWLQPVIRQCH